VSNSRDSTAGRRTSVPRLTLTIPEASAALGVGESTFREYVLPGLRTVRPSPRVVLIAVRELENWIDAHQATYGA
jgi:hypothetical protein